MATSRRYAELHLHLEGCLDENTLVEIAPHLERRVVSERLKFNTFGGFLESFKFAVLQLNEPEDYRLLARNAFRRLHEQGVVYAEVIHSAGVCLWRKQDARAIAKALIEEGLKAPIEVRWIFDAVRQFGPDHVMETAKLTREFCGSEVVGFGVGGDESGCAGDRLKPAFELAKAGGLKLLPHAGENSDAQNVWEALELGAFRIGHGIRAIEDERLLEELKYLGIPLEISITSNVMTGAVASYQAHPVRELYEAGVTLILNTDDPAFFQTTLENEFAHAAKLGFSLAELEEIRLNAFRFACCDTPHP